MTGINHAITGAAIAVAVKQPALALPLAFLSHFALDSLPHWNYEIYGKLRHWSILLDGAASIIVPIAIAQYLDKPVWLILGAALLAVAPDGMWLPYLIQGKQAPMNKKNPLHFIRRQHDRIQWSQTSRGFYYELLWLILMVAVVFVFKR